MFIPENKKIENVGIERYNRAIKHWLGGIGHLGMYHARELKNHIPFCNKERNVEKQWYHLTMAYEDIYAVSLLILDDDTVKEFDGYRKMLEDIWR